MEEKDREVWVEGSRFYLGKDDILYATIVGEIDNKLALEFKDATLKFNRIRKSDGRMNILVDNDRSGKISSNARKVIKELCESRKTGKVAIYGMNPVARVIASFLMGVTRKKDMRFFETREKALAWIKE